LSARNHDKHRHYRLHRINHRHKQKPGALTLVGGLLLLAVTGAASTGIGLFVRNYANAADDASPLADLVVEASLPGNVFYDRNGRLLHQDTNDGILRQPVPLSQVSPHLIDAIISTEDSTFFDNPGVNVRGLTRAAYENIFGGGESEVLEGSGGSSITQQLAKRLYFTYEQRTDRSVERKSREVFLALAINQQYSKEQILEWYMNTLPLGNLTEGVEAASRVYFRKHAAELTLGEAALLAGIPQSPTRYDPYRSWRESKDRQEDVLRLMAERGVISDAEAEAAMAEPLDQLYGFTQGAPDVASLKESDAPHFVRYAQDELREVVGEEVYERGGLKVTTSLDLDMQLTAQRIAQEWSYQFELTHNARNTAFSGIDPASGEILIYVGSRNYNDQPIEGENDILTSLQQPGSTMKVFTYLTAFWKGAPDNPETEDVDESLAHYKPDTLVLDSKINPPLPGCFDPEYSPNNADRSFRGTIPISQALSSSRNVPAVRTIAEVGFRNVIETAHAVGLLGLQDPSVYGCSITVGGGDVRPLDLNYAAATLANNGLMIGRPTRELRPEGYRQLDPVAILRVEDSAGNVVYDYTPSESQVAPPFYAWLVTDTLRLPTGTLGYTICGQDVAAKTGTQEKEDKELEEGAARFSIDTWTMGWSRHLAVTVWVGNSDNTPMTRDSFSTNTAGRLFRSVMETFTCGRERLDFPAPEAPQDYLDTPARPAPPADLLDSAECRELIEESGYQPTEEGVTLDDLLDELCGDQFSGGGGVVIDPIDEDEGGGGEPIFEPPIIIPDPFANWDPFD
jgi:membrane peptidoglycan carboxypeptidase